MNFFTFLAVVLLLPGCNTLNSSKEKAEEKPENSSGQFPLIQLPPGFKIEKVVGGLTYATSLAWDDQGRMYVAEAGGHFLDEPAPARILRIEPGKKTEIVNLGGTDVHAPMVGLTWHDGAFYITHRDEDRMGAVSRVTPDGQVTLLFKGIIDSASEHPLSDIQVGPDGRMYLTTGPAGNAGVIGKDEERFVRPTPSLHTTSAQDIVLLGKNFKMDNFLSDQTGDSVLTGAYVPFSTETRPGQVIKGVNKPGGAILSFDPMNAEQTIRTYAWGFRNIIGIAWNEKGQMYAAENGYDIRPDAARPIKDEIDATFRVREGEWYGYPDFYRSLEPLTMDKFQAPDSLYPPVYINGELQERGLDFVIDHEASGLDAPDQTLVFGRHPFNSSPSKLDVAPSSWGPWAEHVFVAEWGDLRPGTNLLREEPVGYRVVRIDPATGQLEPFIHNAKPGPASEQGAKEMGMERPFDVKFGPDGAMYIVDFGIVNVNGLERQWLPYTGNIWKVTKKEVSDSNN